MILVDFFVSYLMSDMSMLADVFFLILIILFYLIFSVFVITVYMPVDYAVNYSLV